MSVMVSSLVLPRRGYGSNTPLEVAVDIQVKPVANKELESWGCYKVVSELRLTDLKACLKDKGSNANK